MFARSYRFSCDDFALTVHADGATTITDDRGFATDCRSIESAVHTLADRVARRYVSLDAYLDMVRDVAIAGAAQ